MNILLSGATGRMGHMVAGYVAGQAKHKIIAGYAAEEEEGLGFPVYLDLAECRERESIDLIIDFSAAASLSKLLSFALANQLPIVIASTGFSDEQEAEIRQAAEKIPVLHAKNMSLGINVMEDLVKEMAGKLTGFDIEIIEKHHRGKKDSPSGTAKMLFEAANLGRGGSLKALNGRAGDYDSRPDNEVGISAIRGGTIVGEHSVIFAGQDEILEIKHTANSRLIFASGAVRAAEFLLGQPAGFYDMSDVLA